jgi:hypothetical protein
MHASPDKRANPVSERPHSRFGKLLSARRGQRLLYMPDFSPRVGLAIWDRKTKTRVAVMALLGDITVAEKAFGLVVKTGK